MKVAILSHYATWALDGRSGYRPDPQRHPVPWVMNLSHALAQLGTDEIHVVTQTDEIDQDMEAVANGVHLHFVRCPRRWRSATLFQFDCRRLHRVLRNINPDLVHAHGTEDTFSLAGLTSGYPCVITLQGMLFKICEQLPPPFWSRTRLVRQIERWCLKRARHIIAKSDYVTESIRSIAPQARIYPVPNALNPTFFQATAQPEPDRLLFVGIIDPRKGLDHLITAVGQIYEHRPGLRLAVIGVPGHGNEAYYSQICQQIQRIGLHSCMEPLGLQRPEVVAREMARASIVVIPSLEEMFCNVAAEAMAMGRPVIACRTGSLPQLIQDGESGLLVPIADPTALAGAIERLLTDAVLRSQLGTAAKAKALRSWDPATVARQTREVYEAVLQSAGRKEGF